MAQEEANFVLLSPLAIVSDESHRVYLGRLLPCNPRFGGPKVVGAGERAHPHERHTEGPGQLLRHAAAEGDRRVAHLGRQAVMYKQGKNLAGAKSVEQGLDHFAHERIVVDDEKAELGEINPHWRNSPAAGKG